MKNLSLLILLFSVASVKAEVPFTLKANGKQVCEVEAKKQAACYISIASWAKDEKYNTFDIIPKTKLMEKLLSGETPVDSNALDIGGAIAVDPAMIVKLNREFKALSASNVAIDGNIDKNSKVVPFFVTVSWSDYSQKSGVFHVSGVVNSTNGGGVKSFNEDEEKQKVYDMFKISKISDGAKIIQPDEETTKLLTHVVGPFVVTQMFLDIIVKSKAPGF